MLACSQNSLRLPAATLASKLRSQSSPVNIYTHFSCFLSLSCARLVSTSALAKGRPRVGKRMPAVPHVDPQTIGAVSESAENLPTFAYGRVMSSQANYFRIRLEAEGVPHVSASLTRQQCTHLQSFDALQTLIETHEQIEWKWNERSVASSAGLWWCETIVNCTVRDVIQDELLCKMRSLMHKKGDYVLVGDRVKVMNIDWQDARALISDVTPRSSEIMKPKVANVDHFAVVFSLAEPDFEPFQATRFLVAAASSRINCSLILNKCDLVSKEEVQAQIERVRAWGYKAVAVSVQSGQGMEQVRIQGCSSHKMIQVSHCLHGTGIALAINIHRAVLLESCSVVQRSASVTITAILLMVTSL
jgi:hypothetical protein